MATLDQINQGIIAAGEKNDVESARALLAARNELLQQSSAAPPKPTQFASATPTGMDALKALPGEFAGRTKQYAHEQLQAMRDRETKRNQPTLAGVLESMNPLSYAADVGNKLAVAASPFAAAGGMVGARIDPTYGKPGSGGNELQKYEDLSAALAPIPGPKGARLAEALAKPVAGAAARVAAPVTKRTVQILKGPASFIDAGAKAANETVRSTAMAKVMAQQKALSDAQKAVEAGKAADATLRPAMEAKAAAKAAQGVGVSDIPEAQALVADLQGRLKPNNPVATIPNADQAKSYQKVIDVLAPARGSKPDLATVQNLRRELATAYNGDQTGYASIPKSTRKDLVNSLNQIENAYTEGLQAPVQANYTALKAAQKQASTLEKFSPDLKQAAVKMQEMSSAESIKVANGIVDKMQKRGLIPDAEYEDFVQLAQNAKDAAGKSAFRKKMLLLGAGAAGLVTPVGRTALHAVDVP